MRVPIRKPGKYAFVKPDFNMTKDKYNELKSELDHLKAVSQPKAITEMQRLAELGDFSENAAYQIAKSRLRGMNNRILELVETLKRADIIAPAGATDRVHLGNTVTVRLAGVEQTFTILGSAETNPEHGVISHNSPIGAALMGRKVGDTVNIAIKDRKLDCVILHIA